MKNLRKRIVSSHDQTVNVKSSDIDLPPAVLVAERPSPFTEAEKVKRDYSARIDQLLADAIFALETSLRIDSLNEAGASAYQLAELAGYFHRITRSVRRHMRELDELSAQAELAERGQAWVEQTQGGA